MVIAYEAGEDEGCYFMAMKRLAEVRHIADAADDAAEPFVRPPLD